MRTLAYILLLESVCMCVVVSACYGRRIKVAWWIEISVPHGDPVTASTSSVVHDSDLFDPVCVESLSNGSVKRALDCATINTLSILVECVVRELHSATVALVPAHNLGVVPTYIVRV